MESVTDAQGPDERAAPWLAARDPFIVISGGQSGVDRAALESALQARIPSGGWCPARRWAEDGPIDARYPLIESHSPRPARRTGLNVRDSDGTLIIASEPLTGGTRLTKRLALRMGKPLLIVDSADDDAIDRVCAWISDHDIRTLNVAGPRESTHPGAYDQAKRVLDAVLSRVPREGARQSRHASSASLQSRP